MEYTKIKRGSNYEYNSTYARKEKLQDRIKIVQVNFSIIRELFNIIKDNRTTSSMFWMFLLDMSPYTDKKQAKKADAIFTALIYSGNGDYKKHAKKLIDYGVSPEYFCEQYIQAEEHIIKTFTNYCDDGVETPIKKCREVLIKYIFTVKNLDGTLVIDCIRNMLLNMYNIISSQYELSNQIVNIKATTHLSQNNLVKYYKDVIRDYKEKCNHQLSEYNIPDLPEGKIPDKKIYTANSYKGSLTLFLIRETYAVLASMNDINNYMENFYQFIGISETDYQRMIDSEDIPNKKLLQIFEPYKYPASLFRGENPTDINICPEIKEAYDSYQNDREPDFDIECFRNYLKVYLCYKTSTDNINLIIPTCSLIEDMIEKLPYTNFLTPDEQALYNSLQIAETVSATDI